MDGWSACRHRGRSAARRPGTGWPCANLRSPFGASVEPGERPPPRADPGRRRGAQHERGRPPDPAIGGLPGDYRRASVLLERTTIAITAAHTTGGTQSRASPIKTTEYRYVMNGCSSCNWLIFWMPPRASARFHEKKPSSELTNARNANAARLTVSSAIIVSWSYKTIESGIQVQLVDDAQTTGAIPCKGHEALRGQRGLGGGAGGRWFSRKRSQSNPLAKLLDIRPGARWYAGGSAKGCRGPVFAIQIDSIE